MVSARVDPGARSRTTCLTSNRLLSAVEIGNVKGTGGWCYISQSTLVIGQKVDRRTLIVFGEIASGLGDVIGIFYTVLNHIPVCQDYRQRIDHFVRRVVAELGIGHRLVIL